MCLLHRAAEAGTLGQLLADALRHQLRVHFGPVDFDRLDFDVAMGQVFQFLGELVHLGALLADNHADAAGVDVDDDLFASPFDADFGYPRSAIALFHDACEF